MKKLLLTIFVSSLFAVFLPAQSINILYENRSGGSSGVDTVIVYMESTTSSAVAIRAVNFSFAYQFGCSTYGTHTSIFPTHWSSFFQRHLIRRNLSLTYGANTYDSRWLYAIGDANLTSTSFVSVPANGTGLLEVMRITFTGTCNPTIYMEDQTENPVNQIADNNLNSLSYTVVRLSGPPSLPVEYLGWDVEAQANGSALLNWETSSEINNDYFEIEKSFDSDFGQKEIIGQISGKGSSLDGASYSFIDNGLMQPVVYYRLRQVDIDGSFSYSEVKTASFDQEIFGPELAIYPNPAKDLVHVDLSFAGEGEYEIQVLTLEGKLVSSHAVQGLLTKEISLSELPRGVYTIKIGGIYQGIPFTKTAKLVHM